MGTKDITAQVVIETDTWREINTHFYAFLYKQSSIADLHTLLRTLELIRTKDSLTDLEKIAVQTWISEVTIYITTHNFKDIIAPNVSPDTVLEKYNLTETTIDRFSFNRT
jgi:hypothetical protein